MRSSSLLAYFALGCAAALGSACDSGTAQQAEPVPPCPAGQESCGTYCAPIGLCAPIGAAGSTATPGVGGATTGAGGTSTTGSGGGTSTTGSGGSGIVVHEVEPVSANCPDGSATPALFSQQYDALPIRANNGNTKTYYMHSNWWGLPQDAPPYPGITIDGLSFTITSQTASPSPADPNKPIGYPSLYIGSYQARATTGSNLPKQVSALTRIPTTLKSNASSIDTSNLNVAYDVWFTSTSALLDAGAIEPDGNGALLMVWLFDPSGRQPRGTVRASGVTIANTPGSWDVWVDPMAPPHPPCISYVSRTPLSELDFDLNNFIQDSVSHQYGVTSSQYLSVIFGGTEIWNGGAGLSITGFCAIVE